MLTLFYLLNIIKKFVTKIIVIIQIAYYFNNTLDIPVISYFVAFYLWFVVFSASLRNKKEKICQPLRVLTSLIVFFLNKISERSHL